ncbi:YALIA101S12e01574g1_1 [Yarrowia lipolytica]|nr:Putative ATP-dependent helicase [Yarrowia lipolytica]SEI36515.1 YALIA101S12e01574g1_1 [Yarrowia lipolytica]
MNDSIENLNNLLLLGVIFVTGHPKLPCEGESAPDGWNWPPSTWFRLTNLSVPLRELRYLYDTKAIRVTCTSTPLKQLLSLRIYLVPEELRVKTQPKHLYSFALQHMHDKRKSAISRLIPFFYIPGKQTPIVPFYRTSLGVITKMVTSEERLNSWLSHLCNDPAKKTASRDELENGKNLLMSLYESVDFVPQYDLSDPHVDAVFSGHVDNLKSELYPYQAETVSQMMHMEETPRTAVSARYLSVKGFFFHPEDLVARKELPETTGLSRGGILAENMGLGKTCICLALICATRKSMATVPAQYSDTLSETMMKLPGNGKISQLKVLVAQRVAELGAPWGLYADRLSSSCVAVLSSIRCTFLMPDIPRVRVSSRTAASREQKPPRRIHLSATTLLVCPDSLPFQWLTETKKHTENLKVIHVSSVDKAPDLDTVLDADLVIITNSILKEVFSNPACSHIQDIRWKRLIVDEGHVVGNNNSILDICGQEWIAECRWVVSGTPTAGLTRLDTTTLFDHKSDLQKLGRIMGEFLKIEPWSSSPSSWQQSVVKPLLAGRYDGFEHAVRVLSGVLVRHQIEDVEQSTRLPPLYNDVVFLNPSFYDRIIANLYVSNICLLNLVDEKKFGLKNLLRRLRGAFVVSTNYETRDIQFFLDELSAYIYENRVALTGPDNENDARLIKKIFSALNYAATSGNWLQIAGTQEMPFFVEDETRTSRAFQMANPLIVRDKREYGIIGGAPLTYLQRAASEDEKLDLWTETKSKDGTPLEGVIKELFDDPLFSSRFWTSYNRNVDNKRERKDKKNPAVKNFHHAKQKISPEEYLESVGLKVESAPTGAPQNHHSQLEADYPVSDKPTIVGTGSSKLSYLVSKTLVLVKDHKIIVFYEDVDSAVAVAEAFEAVGIKHLIYTTDKVSKERRAQYLATFEATDNFQVLLMNINAAAHGLNITSASWVFFLSPVWRRDIEAQAIKRAHRIGQKSEVHVETLVLQDTLEEDIYRRRTEISDANDETPKEMVDDDQLRETLLNYALTSMENLHKGTTDEVAFFDKPVPLYIKVDKHDQFENSLVHFEGLPVRKKRKKTVVADGFASSKRSKGNLVKKETTANR